VTGQLHATAALPPGKSPRYPLDRKLGGPQNRSGRRGEEKILEPTGTQNPPARSRSLYGLRYPVSQSTAVGVFIENFILIKFRQMELDL
jgi:hypothetical protein